MTEIERLAKIAREAATRRSEYVVSTDFGKTTQQVRTATQELPIDLAPVVIRAILQAMREPSAELACYGADAITEHMRSQGPDCFVSDYGMREGWQAMIDHILSEAP